MPKLNKINLVHVIEKKKNAQRDGTRMLIGRFFLNYEPLVNLNI